jgi:hypothetical protein
MTAHQCSSSFADAGQIAAKLAEGATTRNTVGQALFAEVDLLRLSGSSRSSFLPKTEGRTDVLEVTRTTASHDGPIGHRIAYRYAERSPHDLSVRYDRHGGAQ